MHHNRPTGAVGAVLLKRVDSVNDVEDSHDVEYYTVGVPVDDLELGHSVSLSRLQNGTEAHHHSMPSQKVKG